jgi:hypothetical protein
MIATLTGTRLFLFSVTLLAGLGLIIAFGFALWRLYKGPPSFDPAESVDLAEVISAIKTELRVAEAQGAQILPLREVKLELNVVMQFDAGGEMKASIPNNPGVGMLGLKEVTTKSQKIEVSLKPPPLDLTQGAIDLKDLGLAAAIVKLQNELKKGIDQSPKLDPVSFKIEILFAAKRTTHSQTGVELSVFNATVNAGTENENCQKITLVFGVPEKKDGKEQLRWDP